MWKSQTLALGSDRSLHCAQGGDGPDLVLVHGALATHQDWLAGPAGALSAEYRVTAVDRPGHGDSRRPRFAGTPRDQAGQIVEGLGALGIVRPLVVAHSFGALVALAMAERFELSGLILVAPLAFPEPRLLEHTLLAPRSLPIVGPIFSWIGERSRFDRTMLDFVQRQMFAPAPVPADWKRSFPYDQVLDTGAMVFEGEDAAAILPLSPAGTMDFSRVRLPVHVLTGTADRIVEDERQGKALARLLPNARLTEIEGAGHMLHHTHPELLIGAIRDMAAALAA